MKSPRISVITINYNNGLHLERTIKSVVNQTYGNIEYIVIDGASTDHSIDIIRKYQDHIFFWVSEQDKGVYNAMNKGIRAATGDYLIFINSGDNLDSDNVLEDLLKDIDPLQEYDLIYGDIKMIFPDGNICIEKSPRIATIETMITSTLFHPTTLIAKTLFDRFGLYDERFKIVSDWAFFFKVIAFADVKQSYRPLVVTSFFMDGISNDPNNHSLIEQERKIVLSDLFSPTMVSALEEYPRLKYFYNYPLMRQIRKFTHILRQMKSFIKKTSRT